MLGRVGPGRAGADRVAAVPQQAGAAARRPALGHPGPVPGVLDGLRRPSGSRRLAGSASTVGGRLRPADATAGCSAPRPLPRRADAASPPTVHATVPAQALRRTGLQTSRSTPSTSSSPTRASTTRRPAAADPRPAGLLAHRRRAPRSPTPPRPGCSTRTGAVGRRAGRDARPARKVCAGARPRRAVGGRRCSPDVRYELGSTGALRSRGRLPRHGLRGRRCPPPGPRFAYVSWAPGGSSASSWTRRC